MEPQETINLTVRMPRFLTRWRHNGPPHLSRLAHALLHPRQRPLHPAGNSRSLLGTTLQDSTT